MTKALFAVAALAMAGTMNAALICPATSSSNTDCGFIITIGAGGAITGSAVPGALPYDGVEDSLVGVINNSGSIFTGSITLTSSADIFGFDGDGICGFGSLAGSPSTSYTCSPGGYNGPLNTFTVTTPRTGTVNIVGLAAGATTFFSLEESPSTITQGGGIGVPTGTPEPATFALIGSGLGVLVLARRHKK